MKKILFGMFPLCVGTLFAQDKRTYFHTEVNMIVPNDKKVVYSYSGGEVNLDERIMWGASFTYNYNLFRKFSVGALGGLNYLSNPSITSLKFGGSFRYTFISEYQANLFLQLAGYMPLKSGMEVDLGEVRFGMGMPVARFNDMTMTLGMYVMYARFDFTKPLFFNETYPSLHYRGVGFSLGLRF